MLASIRKNKINSLVILALSTYFIWYAGFLLISQQQPQQSQAASGIITTIAGNGTAGFSGDGGAGTSAQLNFPLDVAADSSGNVYIADHNNHRIRKVDTGGTITTIAGTGSGGFSGDGGAATSAQVNFPNGVFVDANDDIYIADRGNHRIRKIDSGGTITTVAGTGVGGFSGDGGAATSAQLNNPSGVYVQADGTMYIADRNNSRIRKVDTGGTITTFAGNGNDGFAGDGGPATSAEFSQPWDVVVDSAGNVYISDNSNDRIRKVDTGGTITTFAGGGPGPGNGDGGLATSAVLSRPGGIDIDEDGNIYMANNFESRVRKVDVFGIITTAAGDGVRTASGDGNLATEASLEGPSGVFVRNSYMYIADADSPDIRRVQIKPAVYDQINPSANRINTASNGLSQVYFDENMNQLTYTQTNMPFYAGGRLVPGSFFNGGQRYANDLLSFIPTTAYSPGERVYFTVTSGVQNPEGIGSFSYIGSFIQAVTAGDATYSPEFTYPGAATVLPAVETGDVDNDGDQDIISTQGGGVNVLLNNGSGSFLNPVNYSAAGTNQRGLVVADVNRDGYLDAIPSNSGSDSIAVLLNNGNGTFAAATTYSSGVDPREGDFGDLNGDGYLDLVFANRFDADISVFLNNGDGTFAAKVDYPLVGGATLPGDVKVGDADLDGDLDLFVIAQTPGAVQLFLNNGDGTFATAVSYTAQDGIYLTVADLNADSYPDVAVGGSGSQSAVSVLLNNGAGALNTAVAYSTGVGTLGVDFGDLDADNDLDLIASVGGAQDKLAILINNGSGVFAAPTLYDTVIDGDPLHLSLSDFNADGALDFVYVKQIRNNIGVVLSDKTPSVTVIQPNGGETYAPGDELVIQWLASDDSGQVGDIDIAFDDGGGFSSVVSNLTTNGNFYQFTSRVGVNNGTANGDLSGAQGLSIGPNGFVYVADPGNSRIQVFYPDGTPRSFFGTNGSGAGEFNSVTGVAVDSQGNIWTGEVLNNRVQKFDSAGNSLGCLGSGVAGLQACANYPTGNGDYQFFYPNRLAVDSNDNIYVLDQVNDRVKIYNSSGTHIRTFGSSSFGASNYISNANSIYVDANDNLWIADPGTVRVSKYDSSGTFLGWLGRCTSGAGCDLVNERADGFCSNATCGLSSSTGSGEGQFNQPNSVAVSADGKIYTGEGINGRIQIFDASGNFLYTFGSYSGTPGDNEFASVGEVEIGVSGRMYVTDQGSGRQMQIFSQGGFYTWTVPNSITTDGLIRVTASDGVNSSVSDTSDATFTIALQGGTSPIKREAIQNQNNTNQEPTTSPEETTDPEEPTNNQTDPDTPTEEPDLSEEGDSSSPTEEEIDQTNQDSTSPDQQDEQDSEVNQETEEEAVVEEPEKPQPNPEQPTRPPSQEETETIEPTIRDLILQTPGMDQGRQTEQVVEETPEFSLDAEFIPVDTGLNYQGMTDLPGSIVSVTINRGETKLISTDEQGNWMSFVSAAEMGLIPGEVKQVTFDIVAASGNTNSNRVQKTLNLYLSRDGKTVTELVRVDDIPYQPIFPKELILGTLGLIACLLAILGAFYHLVSKKQEAIVENQE